MKAISTRSSPHSSVARAILIVILTIGSSTEGSNMPQGAGSPALAQSSLTGSQVQSPVLQLPRADSMQTYVIEGNLMLGVMISISEQDESKPCGSKLRETGVVQLVEAVVYALKRINERSLQEGSGDVNLRNRRRRGDEISEKYTEKGLNESVGSERAILSGFESVDDIDKWQARALPRGIRLGAVIVDDCNKPVTSLARALSFLPVRNKPDDLNKEESNCGENCKTNSDALYRNGNSKVRRIKRNSENSKDNIITLYSEKELKVRHLNLEELDQDTEALTLRRHRSNKPKTQNETKDLIGESLLRDGKHVRQERTFGFYSNRYPDEFDSDRHPGHFETFQDIHMNGEESDDIYSEMIFHEVVGVVGPEASSASVAVANLLGTFQIPQISPSASTDTLSDKMAFPYFLRMAPPDKHQVEAMIHLIDHFNWTYIAGVYSRGSYGESAIEQLKAMAPRFNICVGPTLAMSQNPSKKELREIITTLTSTKARVVVLFTDQEETRDLFGIVRDTEIIGRFVWLGSDAVGLNLDDLGDRENAAVGALTLNAFTDDAPDFQNYFKSLSPRNNSANPWFKKMWQQMFNCTWERNGNITEVNDGGVIVDGGNSRVSRYAGENGKRNAKQEYKINDFVGKTSRKRRSLRRSKRNNKHTERKNFRKLVDNFRGHEAQNYLRRDEKVKLAGKDFSSLSHPDKTETNSKSNSNKEHVQMCNPDATLADTEKAGDLPRGYISESVASLYMDAIEVYADAISRLLEQHCPEARTRKSVSRCVTGPRLLYQLRRTKLKGYIGNITFDANGDILGKYEVMNFQREEDGNYVAKPFAVWDTITRTLEINDSQIVWNVKDSPANVIPSSQCGVKCGTGEVHSYFKDTCCWECRRCAVNEITTHNATKCEACPVKTWPDQSLHSCTPLTPDPRDWSDPIIILLCILAAGGVIYCTVILCIYIRYNSARLIKATSRELSYLMLAGIFFQFSLLFAVVSTPTTLVCSVTYVGFNISFTLVYAPLLTRTNRIYRIFKNGRKSKVLPSFTSPLSQVLIVVCLVGIQVIINLVICVTSPPEVQLRMPDEFKRYVELSCSVSMEGFVTSLSYSVLLIVVCTWYAFRTRSLPDNFNESRYITLCVYSTLVIWLAFVPSYFTTGRAFHQLILMSSALLLNATVMLLCLYTPKIYAVYHGGLTASQSLSGAGGSFLGANGLAPSEIQLQSAPGSFRQPLNRTHSSRI